MNLGVMQPYFFPYIGYFELINRTDKWIVFDTVQYIRHGWMNRNRILHPANKGFLYITAPLRKHDSEAVITDVQVVEGRQWKDQILRQLLHYKKWAPFYEATHALVRETLEAVEPSLSRMNVHGLKTFCDYLGIRFDYQYFSEMNLPIGEVEGPGDWALRISEAMGAKEYVNPPGGAAFLDRDKFNSVGTKLVIQRFVEYPYSCRRYDYVPALSIIDVCMWNSPSDIKAFLDSYQYEAQAA